METFDPLPCEAKSLAVARGGLVDLDTRMSALARGTRGRSQEVR
jgi:hypothetical protein